MIFLRFGLLKVLSKCPVCKRKAVLFERSREDTQQTTWIWTCPRAKHNHLRESITFTDSLLDKIRQNSWPAFLNYISLLRLQNHALHVIAAEIMKTHGSHDIKTLRHWRQLYQEKLMHVNLKLGHLKVGGDKQVTVIDETCVGVHEEDGFESLAPKGVSKYAPAVRTSTRRRAAVRKRILKRLPGRTVWKKRAAVMKKPSASTSTSVKKKPASVLKRPAGRKDTRANGKWLWAAVTVGRGKEIYNHENGKKRFTFCFLPKRSEASHNKPRGLHEIQKAISNHVKKGSILIFDKWTSTVSAVKRLGFKHAPPVNHSVEFRDRETGFHSNDIESENNRLKHFSRVRNGRLMLNELDLHEYAFYVNVGSNMQTILKALAKK
jgi:hypothetical protein